MSRAFFVGLVGVVATGCLVEPLESDEGGMAQGPEEMRYNAVGLVTVEGHRCTGTLVADRVMVTSKGCLRADLDPRSISFLVDTASPGFGAHGLQLFHQGELPSEIFPGMPDFDDDVVAVVLDHSPATPMPFTRTELPLSMTGEKVIEIGYGSFPENAYRKTWSERTIAAVGTPLPMLATAEGDKDLCRADRGGPLLHQGIIGGVMSNSLRDFSFRRTGPTCGERGLYFQIGRYAHLIDAATEWARTHWEDELPPLPSEYYFGQPPRPVNPSSGRR